MTHDLAAPAVFSFIFSSAAFRHNAVMDIRRLDDMTPFITKDGSEIRELLAHRNSVIRNQSLAEARLPEGASTQEHYHAQTEEIYYITHGAGRIRIDGERQEVRPGDAIAIPPGRRHKLWNIGPGTLRLLSCCAPAYEHADTPPSRRWRHDADAQMRPAPNWTARPFPGTLNGSMRSLTVLVLICAMLALPGCAWFHREELQACSNCPVRRHERAAGGESLDADFQP